VGEVRVKGEILVSNCHLKRLGWKKPWWVRKKEGDLMGERHLSEKSRDSDENQGTLKKKVNSCRLEKHQGLSGLAGPAKKNTVPPRAEISLKAGK